MAVKEGKDDSMRVLRVLRGCEGVKWRRRGILSMIVWVTFVWLSVGKVFPSTTMLEAASTASDPVLVPFLPDTHLLLIHS